MDSVGHDWLIQISESRVQPCLHFYNIKTLTLIHNYDQMLTFYKAGLSFGLKQITLSVLD